MNKKTRYAVLAANNLGDYIGMDIFDTKTAAYNFMKKDACYIAANYDGDFHYKVSEETGRCSIISRKAEYESLQWIELDKDSAEVFTSGDDRFWWQIKKIPA